MSVQSILSTKDPLPFGPFPSPYGDDVNAPIFDKLVNSSLTGEAYCSEPRALPKGAILEVRLLDISIADGPAIMLARNTIVPAEQLPIRFEIDYDTNQIKRGRTYSISATIHADGKLLYANAHTQLVFTASSRSHARVELTSIG